MRLDPFNRLIRGEELVEGRWALTKNHQLQYRRLGAEEELVLTGNLMAAEPNGLLFRLSEQSLDGEPVQQEFSLRGRWQADSKNRLSFWVDRRKGEQEVLTLQGAWEVGPAHEVLYRFAQTDLKTRKRTEQLLRFQGYWQVGEDKRLTYVLDEQSDSAFRFRGTFQTASILPKEGAIRYQVGIEAVGKRRLQTVTLLGNWKLSDDLKLNFEVPYGDDSPRTMTFGATYSIDSQRALSVRLTTQGGKPVGLEVLLTREFLNDQGEAFVRLRKSLEEAAVEGGLRLRW